MAERASLYLRESKTGGDEATTLETQERDLRDLAAKHGYQVYAVHVDSGLSGGKRRRPGFDAWTQDAVTGHVQALLAWHFDRVSREGVYALAALADVIEGKDSDGRKVRSGVRFLTYDDRLDSDDDAFDMVVGVRALVAREERKRIMARNAASWKTTLAQGRWHGGSTPYGYKPAPRDGGGWTLVIDHAQAKAIRWAAAQVLAGTSPTQVARRLNEQGIAPRRAKEWSRASLKSVLTGDAVLGRVRVNGEVPRDDDGTAFTPYDPILDIETSAALRRAFAPRQGGEKFVPTRKHGKRLLSGLLRCAACGNLMTAARTSERGDVYRCMTRAQGGTCSAPTSASTPLLDDHIERRYLDDFGDLPVIERVAVVEPSGLAEVEDRIAAIVARLAASVTPEDVATLQRLQSEREALAAAASDHVYMKAHDTGRTYAEEWESRGLTGRRELLERAYGRLWLGRDPRGLGRRDFNQDRLAFEKSTVED